METISIYSVDGEQKQIVDSTARTEIQTLTNEVSQIETDIDTLQKDVEDIKETVEAGAVTSVNGKAGDVILVASDVNAAPSSHTAKVANATDLGHVKVTEDFKNNTDNNAVPSAKSIKDYSEELEQKIESKSEVPTNHASEDAGFGLGTSSKYGHVKVSGNFTGSSNPTDGIALSEYGAQQMYQALKNNAGGIQSVNGKTDSNIELNADDVNAAPVIHTSPAGLDKTPTYGGGTSDTFGHVSLTDEYNNPNATLETDGAQSSKGASAYAVQQMYNELINSGAAGGTHVVANPEGEATDDLTKVQIGTDIYNISGGGSTGTTDYNELDNKPQINGHPLVGNQTGDELGLLTEHQDISGKVDIAQGSANEGKILKVDADGNLVLVNESGGGSSSGDNIYTPAEIIQGNWTATSSNALHAQLTESITLTPGTYLVILQTPVWQQNNSTQQNLAYTIWDSTHEKVLEDTYNSAFLGLNSVRFNYNNVILFTKIIEDTTIYGATAASANFTYSYIERGKIQAVRLADSTPAEGAILIKTYTDVVVSNNQQGIWRCPVDEDLYNKGYRIASVNIAEENNEGKYNVDSWYIANSGYDYKALLFFVKQWGTVTQVTTASPVTVTWVKQGNLMLGNKEITKAEYDSLTEEEKNNGQAYFIKDLTVADDFHVYSNDEQIVGQWIDGKPLYERTVTDFGTLPNASEKKYDVSSWGIHNVISWDGIIQSAKTFLPLHYADNSSQSYTLNNIRSLFRGTTDNVTDFSILTGINRSTDIALQIQVKYTKTSDYTEE